MSDSSQAFEELIKQAAKDTGVALKMDAKALALYADQRAAHLVTLIGQNGYEDAVIAERDAVILKAGIASVNAADRMQARFIGVLEGALSMAARLLA